MAEVSFELRAIAKNAFKDKSMDLCFHKRAKEIFQQRTEGVEFRDISKELGISKEYARQVYSETCKLLARYQEYPFTALENNVGCRIMLNHCGFDSKSQLKKALESSKLIPNAFKGEPIRNFGLSSFKRCCEFVGIESYEELVKKASVKEKEDILERRIKYAITFLTEQGYTVSK